MSVAETFSSKVSQGYVWKDNLLGDCILFLHDVIDVLESTFEEGFMFLDLLSLSYRIGHSVRVEGWWKG
jgi:hypothetical protein